MEKKNSDARIRANNKYNAAHTRIIPIRLNFTTDQDILNHLETVPSVAGYIKQLIREDMQRGDG
jgi:hypothetical protein